MSVIIADSGIIKYFLRNIGNRTVSFCGLKLKRDTEFSEVEVGIRNEFRASRQTSRRHAKLPISVVKINKVSLESDKRGCKASSIALSSKLVPFDSFIAICEVVDYI